MQGNARGRSHLRPASLSEIVKLCNSALAEVGGWRNARWVGGDVTSISRQPDGVRIRLRDGPLEIQLRVTQRVMDTFAEHDRKRGNLPQGWIPGRLRLGDAVVAKVAVSPVPGQAQWSLDAAVIGRPPGGEDDVHGQLYDDFHLLQKEDVIDTKLPFYERMRSHHNHELRPRAGDRPLRKVIVLSSSHGDGLHDFTKELTPKQTEPGHDPEPLIKLEHRPVPVQGEHAAAAISEAIAGVQKGEANYIALIRGGGNLAAFNDPELARRIRRSAVPVITGIGHTRNVTLADCAAAASFDVPKKAATALKSLYYSQRSGRAQAPAPQPQPQPAEVERLRGMLALKDQQVRQARDQITAKDRDINALQAQLLTVATARAQEQRDAEALTLRSAGLESEIRRCKRTTRRITAAALVALVLVAAGGAYVGEQLRPPPAKVHKSHKAKAKAHKKAKTAHLHSAAPVKPRR